MISQNSIWRDKGFIKLILCMGLGISCFIILMEVFVFTPLDNKIQQMEDNDKLKTQQEHDKLVLMDCKTLGNWLLQDNVWSHDNLIWAQNHYLVNCK